MSQTDAWSVLPGMSPTLPFISVYKWISWPCPGIICNEGYAAHENSSSNDYLERRYFRYYSILFRCKNVLPNMEARFSSFAEDYSKSQSNRQPPPPPPLFDCNCFVIGTPLFTCGTNMTLVVISIEWVSTIIPPWAKATKTSRQLYSKNSDAVTSLLTSQGDHSRSTLSLFL